MSQRDFNNNTANTSEIFNTISLLPTKTDVNTSIATNNLNYTTSLLTATLINNNIIANNLLYTSTVNLNILLANAVTSRDTAISAAASSCNTYSNAYTNTKISTEIVRADASIATNNLINLALSKTYTAKQSFTDIDLTGQISITAICNGTIQYGYNSSAGNQCIAIRISANSNGQINATAVGHNSKCFNGFNVSLGCYANSYLNCIAIGYNAGNQSNSNNTGCTYIGSNSNINYTTTHTNSTAIGIGSMISNSNTIQLGRDLIDNTNCFSLSTTNLTVTNIISNGITILNYSTLPLFTSYKNPGYSNSVTNIKNNLVYDSVNNLTSLTLLSGIYLINFSIFANYSQSSVLYWMSY